MERVKYSDTRAKEIGERTEPREVWGLMYFVLVLHSPFSLQSGDWHFSPLPSYITTILYRLASTYDKENKRSQTVGKSEIFILYEPKYSHFRNQVNESA